MLDTKEQFRLFCDYQLNWMREKAGVAGAEKSRRIGWTYADAFDETINRVGPKPKYNFDCWYSGTDMTAAEEYIGYVGEFASMVNAVAKISDGEIEVADDAGGIAKIAVMRATFDNGLRITAGSSNPKFFRSKGGAAKLDELAFHDRGREMYKAAHATARFWGYPLRFWSSHHGPGSYFNSLVKDLRAGKLKGALHRTTILDAVEQGIVERVRMRREKLSDIPPVDLKYRQEWLDTLHAECPDEDVWNEEYMCIPSSDAGAFLDYELLRACEVTNLQMWDLPTPEKPWPEDRVLYAGCDVARRRDLFVLYVFERIGDVDWTRLIHVRQGATFTQMEDAIDRVLACPSVRRLCQDQTGIGEQMAERMKNKWGHRYEGVLFTGPVKIDLAMPLRRAYEDKRLRNPADDVLREDLHSVKKFVTAAGNVRFEVDQAETDGHADRFWAQALAYHAADSRQPLPAPLMKKPFGW